MWVSSAHLSSWLMGMRNPKRAPHLSRRTRSLPARGRRACPLAGGRGTTAGFSRRAVGSVVMLGFSDFMSVDD